MLEAILHIVIISYSVETADKLQIILGSTEDGVYNNYLPTTRSQIIQGLYITYPRSN